jgi:hypothetical protein
MTIIAGTVFILYLYLFYIAAVNESINEYEGMGSIALFILIRIFITIGMTIYAFRQWYKQKELCITDINFMFGLFFLGLVYGKFINLLFILTYFTVDDNTSLMLLKIRYILIILTAAPLIFVGLEIIFKINGKLYGESSNKSYGKRLSLKIVATIVIIESIIIILTPDITSINLVLICIHIPSLIWITYTFYYAHKNKKYIKVKSLIISLAFFIDLILYTMAIITLPFRRKVIGFSPFYTIFTELIDLIIIIIIFLGFYLQKGYLKEEFI